MRRPKNLSHVQQQRGAFLSRLQELSSLGVQARPSREHRAIENPNSSAARCWAECLWCPPSQQLIAQRGAVDDAVYSLLARRQCPDCMGQAGAVRQGQPGTGLAERRRRQALARAPQLGLCSSLDRSAPRSGCCGRKPGQCLVHAPTNTRCSSSTVSRPPCLQVLFVSLSCSKPMVMSLEMVTSFP